MIGAIQTKSRLLVIVMATMIGVCELAAEDAAPNDSSKYGRKLDDQERAKALELLIKAIQENYDRILTWKGEYRFADRYRFTGKTPTPSGSFSFSPAGTPPQLNHGEIATGQEAGGGYWEFCKGTFRFTFDQSKNSYYVRYTPTELHGLVDVTSGAEGFYTNPASRLQGLLTPQYAFSVDMDSTYGILSTPELVTKFPENWSSLVINRHSSKFGLHLARLFDTRDVYARPLQDCRRFLEFLRGDKGDEFRQIVDKSLAMYVNDELPPTYTLLRTRNQGGKTYVSQTIFGGEAGFNVVNDLYNSSERRIELAITYRNIDGVFIPQNYERDDWSKKGERPIPTEHRFFELISAKLNGDIPEVEFDINQFGFKYGDRMIDETETKVKKLFVYDDLIGFIPADQFHFDSNRVRQQDSQ